MLRSQDSPKHMALSLTSRQSLETIRDYADANNRLPDNTTIESEISQHYLEFGFLTREAFRRELKKDSFVAMIKAFLSGPLTLTASARESLQWCISFVESNGSIPARNMVDFEIAKHFSTFRFSGDAALRRELSRSSFLAMVKIILSTSLI
jgi:hypothetical protein